MSVADCAGVLTALATLVGLVFIYKQLAALSDQAKLQTRQLELQANQAKLQVYSDYTSRYEALVARFPEDVNSKEFKLDPSREDYKQTMRAMRSYFDLCFEEWDLHSKGLIDRAFWETWEGGIRAAISKTSFQQAWAIVRRDSDFGRSFESFLDGLARRSQSSSRTH